MLKPVLKVTSSCDRKTVNLIKGKFSEKTGKQIDFEIRTDDSLIGGFIAYIDGSIYDASVSSRIDDISRYLGESSDQSDFWVDL